MIFFLKTLFRRQQPYKADLSLNPRALLDSIVLGKQMFSSSICICIEMWYSFFIKRKVLLNSRYKRVNFETHHFLKKNLRTNVLNLPDTGCRLHHG